MKRILGLFYLTAVLAVAPLPGAVITFLGTLTGDQESPVVVTPGTGETTVTWDTDANSMRVQADFSGLIGLTTAAHIHVRPNFGVPNGGVATAVPTFPGFPLGVQAGAYDMTFDMLDAASYNPSFLNNAMNGGDPTTAANTLLTAMMAGRTYLNVHSTFSPSGEIRANLVPEPGTIGLMAAGALALVIRRRFAA